ncbi:MAG: hypothetical protein QXZ44_06945 [Ferroplasma sp.]
MINMNWKIISAIFIAATIILAGSFIALYYVDSSAIHKEEKQDASNEVEELAISHWNQIAIENQSIIMKEYDNNATLHWIGGPLNGTYSGYNAINTTWGKFFTAWKAVWFYASTNMSNNPVVSMHGKTANVTANFLQFVLENNTNVYHYINTTYSLEYYNVGSVNNINYEIIGETFQITGTGTLASLK